MLTLSLASTTLLLSPVSAVSRGNDQITIETPIEGARVSGNVEIKWLMRDSNQNPNNISFLVDLFSNSCPNNGAYYGTIIDSHKNVTRSGDTFTYLWDTKGAIKNKSNVPDGDYCFRICAIFIQGNNNYYGLCDKHSITIANTANQSPKISSTPSNLNLKVGDKYKYQVIATDPEGDLLQFSLQQASPILDIDQSTGLITSGALTSIGHFTITVVVVDGKGGSDKQVFTLNVTNEGSQNAITFTLPAKDQIYQQNQAEIKWQITNSDNVASQKLSYSSDGENWTLLASPDPTARQYIWDISKVSNGEYFLELEATLKSKEVISKVTDPFTISHETPGESIPLITDLQPEDGSKITNLRPVISAKYTPSDGATIDPERVSISLNSSPLTNCQKTAAEIKCTLQQDLSIGKNKLTIQVEDSLKKVVVRDWFVEIEGPSGPQIQTNNLLPILLLICLGVLAIAIPWILYVVYRRRKAASGAPIAVQQSPAPIPAPIVQTVMQPTLNQTPTYQETAPPLIGTHEVVMQTPLQPAPSVAPMGANNEPTIQQPSMYSSQELPAWLKDMDTASNPVTESGQTSPVSPQQQQNEQNKASQPYGFD